MAILRPCLVSGDFRVWKRKREKQRFFSFLFFFFFLCLVGKIIGDKTSGANVFSP